MEYIYYSINIGDTRFNNYKQNPEYRYKDHEDIPWPI